MYAFSMFIIVVDENQRNYRNPSLAAVQHFRQFIKDLLPFAPSGEEDTCNVDISRRSLFFSCAITPKQIKIFE